MDFLLSIFSWAAITTIFWLALLIIFLLVEAATAGLVSLWFAGGALAAMIVSMLNGQLWLQVVLFLIVSAALLACLRPFVRRFITPKKARTNADRFLGSEALVTERIDNLTGTGAVRISGVEWTARSESRETIEVGTVVTVLRIEGAKVTVAPAEVAAES